MAQVDHRTTMDAASMITAQLENLVSEIRTLRLEMESIGNYMPAITAHLATIAANYEENE